MQIYIYFLNINRKWLFNFSFVSLIMNVSLLSTSILGRA